LALTAEEAVMFYGQPKEPLLAKGTVSSLPELVKKEWGNEDYAFTYFKLTSAEHLAQWLNTVTPFLLGIAFLLLFIEFKTPVWRNRL